MNKKSWVILSIAGPVILVITAISMTYLYSILSGAHHDRVLKAYESVSPPEMKAYSIYHTTFETHADNHVYCVSFFTRMPDSEDVFMVTLVRMFREGVGFPEELTLDEWPKQIKHIECSPLNNPSKEILLTDFQILCDGKNTSEANRTSPDLWMVKVPSHFKKLAIPMRLEPLVKHEPVWYFGAFKGMSLLFDAGVVSDVQGDQITVIIEPDKDSHLYSGIPLLDKEGYVVGVGFHWKFNIAYTFPASEIRKRILNAAPKTK